MKEFVEVNSNCKLTENLDNDYEKCLYEQRVHLVRCFCILHLRLILRFLIQSDDTFSIEFFQEIFEFLIQADLSENYQISKKTSKVCWDALFRIMDLLLTQWLFSQQQHSFNENSTKASICQFKNFEMNKFLFNICKIFKKRIGSLNCEEEYVKNSLDKCLNFLKKIKLDDQLDRCFLALCGVGCFYLLAEPNEGKLCINCGFFY